MTKTLPPEEQLGLKGIAKLAMAIHPNLQNVILLIDDGETTHTYFLNAQAKDLALGAAILMKKSLEVVTIEKLEAS